MTGLCPLGEAGQSMNEPGGKLTLIDENHMLCASLISKYAFCQVKDVIEEACKHQRDADEAKLKDIMGQVKAKYEAKLALLPTKEEAQQLIQVLDICKPYFGESYRGINNSTLAKLKVIAGGS